MATSFLSYNLTTNYYHVNTTKLQNTHYDPLSCHLTMPKHNSNSSFSVLQHRPKRDLKVVQAIPGAEGFLSILPADTPWYAWAGAAMIAIPLAVQRIVKLTNEVESVAETIEGIADAVGKVADQIDAAADDLVEKLPDGKLKEMVTKVDRIVEATSREAQKVEDLMDKVEEMSNEIEDFIVKSTKKEEEAAKKEAANVTSENK